MESHISRKTTEIWGTRPCVGTRAYEAEFVGVPSVIPCTTNYPPCNSAGAACIEVARPLWKAEVGGEDPEWLTLYSR
jgi:hypothetical protein